jgi:hypothetical protein
LPSLCTEPSVTAHAPPLSLAELLVRLDRVTDSDVLATTLMPPPLLAELLCSRQPSSSNGPTE